VVFVGSMGHGPNVDGLRWFLTSVWNGILGEEPAAELHVWGSGLDSPLTREFAAYANVHVRGRYAQSEEVYTSARVAVAPIRTGAGLKCKVLDAMLHGIPAVGTSIAYEGIDVPASMRDLVVDDPERFIAATVGLLRHDDLWHGTSGRALAFVSDRFTPDAELVRMADLVARLDVDPSVLDPVMR
jgi:glycosyltransferase involved in cell wall biosynthesis